MKIGINGYETVVQRFGFNKRTGFPNRVGSSEYCFNIIENLNRLDLNNDYYIYLPINPTGDLPKESQNWHYKIVKKKTLWSLFDLSKDFLFSKEKLNVFFSPTHYLPIYSPFPSIISIMDLSYIYYPGLFKKKDLYQLKLWTYLSVKKAKKIITISQSSKDDIIKNYKVSGNKIVVIYPGLKDLNSNNNMKDIKKEYGIKNDFILFVGTLQPRKNVARLIEAFSKMDRKDLDLVVIGKRGWLYEDILGAPEKFGVKDRVRFLDFVSDEDLPSFYKSAVCYVLPSLYEGFGLPVLEAMKFGCPVLTSNVSSLPEAGGDAAIYFDPLNVDDIKSKIEKVINDKKLQKEMRDKGYEQVKKFSWERAAKETLKVLEEVAKKE